MSERPTTLGRLSALPLELGGEVRFILDQEHVLRPDVHVLKRVLEQILGRKVWVLAAVDDKTVPFD
jgi:hypothetical protein